MSCSPKGILHADAEIVNGWVENCRREVEMMRRPIDRIKYMMRVADNCASVGFHSSATGLYREALEYAMDTDWACRTMHYRRYAIECARRMEEIARRHRNDMPRNAVADVMEVYQGLYVEFLSYDD